MAVLTDRLWITKLESKSSVYIGQYLNRIFVITKCCSKEVRYSHETTKFSCTGCTEELLKQPEMLVSQSWELFKELEERTVIAWVSNWTLIPVDQLEVTIT